VNQALSPYYYNLFVRTDNYIPGMIHTPKIYIHLYHPIEVRAHIAAGGVRGGGEGRGAKKAAGLFLKDALLWIVSMLDAIIDLLQLGEEKVYVVSSLNSTIQINHRDIFTDRLDNS
jgi:hypothetical protein